MENVLLNILTFFFRKASVGNVKIENRALSKESENFFK